MFQNFKITPFVNLKTQIYTGHTFDSEVSHFIRIKFFQKNYTPLAFKLADARVILIHRSEIMIW